MSVRSSSRSWMLPDEPVPVRLMGTIWADVAGIHDDLGRPGDVDAWLDAVGIDRSGQRASDADLIEAVRLRDAVRRLASHVTADSREPAASAMPSIDEAIRTLNETVSHTPFLRLARHEQQLLIDSGNPDAAVRTGLAKVAEQAMRLLSGTDAAKLRACNAPGCVLYFVKAHPRREWCSIACGNRARAARHYDRVRAGREPREPRSTPRR